MFKFIGKLIFLGLLAAVGFAAYVLFLPKTPATSTVMLRPGSSARHIAKDLEAAGVIRSAPAFLALHYVRGLKPLKAGEYAFDRAMPAVQIYDRLAKGDIVVHTVTVPEGTNIYEIAMQFEKAGLATHDEFLKAVRAHKSLIGDLDPAAQSLEGYLFPDTYNFTKTQALPDMLAQMVKRFRQEAQKIGLTSDVHRVVTMASIVEKETGAAEERPKVASVYYNRLARNMALGADPAVVYAALLGNRWRGTIYQSDLDYDSPYNTYKYPGLPPGPIANPGVASLEAAMHPAQTDYIFFVSDNNGHHRFATTSAEHEKNVALYRAAVGH